MRIKANQNFYRNILLLGCNGLFIFMGSLAYFLGFAVNAESLLYYALFVFASTALFYIIYLVVDKCNKKHLIFDEEKITEESKHGEKVIVYYNQILSIKYRYLVDIFNGILEFGVVEIAYVNVSTDRGSQRVALSMSKKNYKKFQILLNSKIGGIR